MCSQHSIGHVSTGRWPGRAEGGETKIKVNPPVHAMCWLHSVIRCTCRAVGLRNCRNGSVHCWLSSCSGRGQLAQDVR